MRAQLVLKLVLQEALQHVQSDERLAKNQRLLLVNLPQQSRTVEEIKWTTRYNIA